MKYIAIFLAAFAVMAGCATPVTHNYDNNNSATYTAPQQTEGIVDEEYDLLVAPQYDYNANVPYEQQIKTAPSAKSTAKKTNTKPKAYKQN